jgi:phosphoglycerate kinase
MTETVETYEGLRLLAGLPLEGRRVLVRTDFDASEGLGSDRFRLALPTLETARSRGAKLIVATTQTPNDPSKGPPDIEAAATRLAEAFGIDVFVPDECAGDAAKKIIQELRPGQVCVLPDLGSEPEQAENEHGLAERLGALADVYVNDAFAASHRKGTPFDPLPRLVREHGIGLWFERELQTLDSLKQGQTPFLAVIGGPATRENFGLLEALLRRATRIAVGGPLGNSLLKARGADLQATPVNDELLAEMRSFLSRARDRKIEILLPTDVLAGDSPSADLGLPKDVKALPQAAQALDLGPQSLERLKQELGRAKAVLWSGALGACENPAFSAGTLGFAEALAAASAPVRVVFDGPLISALIRSTDDLVSKIGFVSTSGRAGLEYIEGRTLPALEALRGGAT